MKKLKILVVDDELASNIIRTLNYVIPNFQPSVATNKIEAIALLNSSEFDLITLDGKLNDGDHGRDILKEMSESQISKTIVYSADPKFIEECINKGIKFVEKSSGIISKAVTISQDGESIEFLI